VNPAVVVLAYNRPAALQRLLDSVAAASYPTGGAVPLVISIDPGGDGDVAQLAERFPWPHGEKKVMVAETHLGLVAHFHRAGALATTYGSIILLEDDLVVSPAYYSFAGSALDFYRDDDRIAGISLYALWFNGYNHLPFVPFPDAADVFFLQIPFYVGQAFTAAQWDHYRTWRATAASTLTPDDPLHPLLLEFGPEEWFPERIKYLAATGRFCVYPRESLSSGYGDAGTHFERPSRWFQAPMQRFERAPRFIQLSDSVAVYDAFFEMLPDRMKRLAPAIHTGDFDVDLYASKPGHAFSHDRVLTSRTSRAPLARFGRDAWPMEANVIDQVPGEEIVLSRVADLRWGWWEDLRVEGTLSDYFARGRVRSWRRRVAFTLLQRLGRRARSGR
jgi:hypothetical protein